MKLVTTRPLRRASVSFIAHRARGCLKLRAISPLGLIPTEGRQAQVLPAQKVKKEKVFRMEYLFFYLASCTDLDVDTKQFDKL